MLYPSGSSHIVASLGFFFQLCFERIQYISRLLCWIEEVWDNKLGTPSKDKFRCKPDRSASAHTGWGRPTPHPHSNLSSDTFLLDTDRILQKIICLKWTYLAWKADFIAFLRLSLSLLGIICLSGYRRFLGNLRHTPLVEFIHCHQGLRCVVGLTGGYLTKPSCLWVSTVVSSVSTVVSSGVIVNFKSHFKVQ